MPSCAADGALARAFSSLLLSPPPERPSTPPTPEMPLSPSSASSFILLTPPSPTFTGPILDSPTHHPAAPPSSPTELEGRGRQRSRSASPTPSLGLEPSGTTPSATSGARSTSLPPQSSRSPRRDAAPNRPGTGFRPRSASINTLIRTCEDPLIFSIDFDIFIEYLEDDLLSDSNYGWEMTDEEWELHMEEVTKLGCQGEGCNCNPDLWDDAVAEHFDWDSFDESFQIGEE